MLAGRVKLKNFLAVIAALAALAFVGLYFLLKPAPLEGLEEPQRWIMEHRDRRMEIERERDVVRGHAYRIDLEGSIGGRPQWAWIDLDRDDYWDEEWHLLRGGDIHRRIATADDGQPDRAFDWNGRVWELVPHFTAGPELLGRRVPVPRPSPRPAPTQEPLPVASAAVSASSASAAIPPVHRWLLERAGRSLGRDRVQDATRGQPWKVNLYQDDGFAVMNRAKIDLDRDDQWDEKWTFHEDGRITRQVSPNDDEQYTERSEWNGSRWVTEGEAVLDETPGAEPAVADGEPGPSLRVLEVHAWVARQQGRDIGSDRVRDATPGRAWRVSLYQDDGFAATNRAKVDLDRDGAWDEKWTFHPDGRITRQRSPNDDETYSERSVWNDGSWTGE